MGRQSIQVVLCVLAGLVVAAIAVIGLRYTMAFAVPNYYLDWFVARDSLRFGLFVWDLLITSGLAIGLPALLTLLVIMRFSTLQPLLGAGCFVVGVVAYILVANWLTAIDTMAEQLSRPWWSFSFEASLALAVVTALLLARRLRLRHHDKHPRNSLYGKGSAS